MSFDKSTSKIHSQHTTTRNIEPDVDPYSPVIVEDLLHVRFFLPVLLFSYRIYPSFFLYWSLPYLISTLGHK